MPDATTIAPDSSTIVAKGSIGPRGPGVPTGGADGQVLTKQSATNFDTAWETPSGGGGGVTDADFLVGTAHAGLSAEIVVGTTPGGELGGTWASPTVDATHSGSSHASVQAAAEATAAADATSKVSTHAGAADPHGDRAYAAALVTTHEADTTSVHGITDTSVVELTTRKDVVSGYAGLSTGQVITQNLQPPERRWSYSQRAASMFLAGATTSLVKELWVTDSYGHAGSSASQTTSCIAQYEAEMARAYNTAARGVGFQPVQLWNGIAVETDGAMAWDSVPANQHQSRGPNLANKTMTAGQTASTTRDGTAVTIYYTERPSSSAGGVVTVSVNGYGATTIAAGSNGVNTSTFAGSGTLNVATNGTTGFPSSGTLTVANASTTAVITYTGKGASTFTGCTEVTAGGVMSTGGAVNLAIDNRNGSLGSGVFNSGKSITVDNPTGTNGPIAVVLTHASLGTTFELEGAYFHSANTTTGHLVLRADKAGATLDTLGTSAGITQFITNQQPHIITIMAGVNDENAGASASTLATRLATAATNYRACYSTWTPAIRYVFQQDSSWVGSTWLTTYRAAMRQACIDNDILFLDLSDVVGSIDGSDPLNFSDDALHPNDSGHKAIGQFVAHHTSNVTNRRSTPLDLANSSPQFVLATLGNVILKKATTAPHVETMLDGSSATASAADLGYFGFRGTTDIYGTPTGNTVSAVLGRAEGTFSATANKAGLRFYVTAPSTNSPIVGAGLTGDSVLFVGPSLGSSNFSVTLAGVVTATSYGAVSASSVASSGTISGTAITGSSVAVTGALTSSSASAGVGYATGAGSTVTQATSKSTGVTLNNVCGQITTHTETLNAGAEVSFTLTNSRIAAGDVPVVAIKSGATTNTYTINVTAVAAGSCRIQIGNVSGSSATEVLVLNFAVIKAVAA